MRQSLVAKIAMMGVAAVATVGLASAGEIKEERRQFDQRELSVYDPAGSVRIEAGEGPFITINVARGGKDAERIKLKSDFVDDVASLAVVFPGDAVVYPAAGVASTDVFVNGEGKFGPEIAGRRMTIATQGEGLEAWADMVVRVRPAAISRSRSASASSSRRTWTARCACRRSPARSRPKAPRVRSGCAAARRASR